MLDESTDVNDIALFSILSLSTTREGDVKANSYIFSCRMNVESGERDACSG